MLTWRNAARCAGRRGYGVAGADGVDAGPVPVMLVAVTVNVYGWLLVRPVTVHDVPAVVQVNPPGAEVTR